MTQPAFKIFSSDSNKPANQKNLKALLPLGILLFAIMIIVGCSYYWFFYLENFVTTDDAYIEADFYPVSTKVAGAVKEVYVREGQVVKKGALLLAIDESDFAFEKKFKQMKLQKAHLDFERSKTLHSTKAISDFDYENADANLKAAEVDLEGTEIKINYTKITAPADGIVAKRSVQIGQIIQPGQSLIIIVNNKEQWVRANFKETQIENLKIGQKVQISLDGLPHNQIVGTVDMIFPSSGAKLSILPPENSTGNFTRVVQRIPVKIKLDSENRINFLIKAGMSAEVKVDIRERIADSTK